MPDYFYNNDPQQVAAFGQGLGQSLGQAFIGLPQQRAEIALRLAELQRQNAQMQQMGQYRNAELSLRQQDLQRKTNYNDLMGQFHLGQNQNAEMANQIRMMVTQLAQQRALAPRVQGGQVISGQQVPMPMPAGQYGPSRQELGADAPTGIQWKVSPVAPKPQPQFPPTLLSSLAAMQRNYMAGLGSTNQAMQDYSRTNIGPLLQSLQQRLFQGQPTQQALTNGVPQPATQSNTNDPLGLF